MSTQNIQRSIRLPRDLHEAVVTISILEDRTPAQVIRRAVRFAVEAKQLDTPEKRASALGAVGRKAPELVSN